MVDFLFNLNFKFDNSNTALLNTTLLNLAAGEAWISQLWNRIRPTRASNLVNFVTLWLDQIDGEKIWLFQMASSELNRSGREMNTERRSLLISRFYVYRPDNEILVEKFFESCAFKTALSGVMGFGLGKCGMILWLILILWEYSRICRWSIHLQRRARIGAGERPNTDRAWGYTRNERQKYGLRKELCNARRHVCRDRMWHRIGMWANWAIAMTAHISCFFVT